MSRPLLQIDAITRSFAGLTALSEISLAVMPSTIHAVIGPNGAGKTTLFNIISGLLPPDAGRIVLRGRSITALPAHRRAALGIGRTFQSPRMFGDMSALENVMTGMHPMLRVPWPATLLRFPDGRKEERQAQARALGLLGRVGLQGASRELAGTLAYGDQRRLEMARALASEPVLLLLDEPAAGLNATETAKLAELLKGLRRHGLTILLIEHDMNFVMGVSDDITVLNFGHKIAAGTPAAVRADRRVIEAYLGADLTIPHQAAGNP